MALVPPEFSKTVGELIKTEPLKALKELEALQALAATMGLSQEMAAIADLKFKEFQEITKPKMSLGKALAQAGGGEYYYKHMPLFADELKEAPKVYHQNNKNDWGTPWEYVKWIESVAPVTFDLDPFASQSNAKAPVWYDEEADGLKAHWFGNVFMNPPYDKTKQCLAKAAHEFKAGHIKTICALVAARPDTNWWWDALKTAHAIWFFKGRIKFEGATSGAPFPSACIWWSTHKEKHWPSVTVAWVDMKGTKGLVQITGALGVPGKSLVHVPHMIGFPASGTR